MRPRAEAAALRPAWQRRRCHARPTLSAAAVCAISVFVIVAAVPGAGGSVPLASAPASARAQQLDWPQRPPLEPAAEPSATRRRTAEAEPEAQAEPDAQAEPEASAEPETSGAFNYASNPILFYGLPWGFGAFITAAYAMLHVYARRYQEVQIFAQRWWVEDDPDDAAEALLYGDAHVMYLLLRSILVKRHQCRYG